MDSCLTYLFGAAGYGYFIMVQSPQLSSRQSQRRRPFGGKARRETFVGRIVLGSAGRARRVLDGHKTGPLRLVTFHSSWHAMSPLGRHDAVPGWSLFCEADLGEQSDAPILSTQV
jgi:hypothetical protein